MIDIKSKSQLRTLLYSTFKSVLQKGKIRREMVDAFITDVTRNVDLPEKLGAREMEHIKRYGVKRTLSRKGGIRKGNVR